MTCPFINKVIIHINIEEISEAVCRAVEKTEMYTKSKSDKSLSAVLWGAVYDALFNTVYKAVYSVVRASKAVLGRTVKEVLDNLTVKKACQRIIELCIAELNCVGLMSNLVQGVAAAGIAKRAAAQLAKQSADAVAAGSIQSVAVDRIATAKEAFPNTLLSSTVISITFLVGSVIYSQYEYKKEIITKEERNRRVTKQATGVVGSIAGSTTGAFVGTLLLPGIGTFVGGFIGGMFGNVVGSATGAAVYDEMPAPKEE